MLNEELKLLKLLFNIVYYLRIGEIFVNLTNSTLVVIFKKEYILFANEENSIILIIFIILKKSLKV